MGRKRQYATATERQAAYRRRMKETTIWVDRAPFERMALALDVLYEATWQARKHGNLLAQQLYRSTPVETLETTVSWIIRHLEAPDEESQ